MDYSSSPIHTARLAPGFLFGQKLKKPLKKSVFSINRLIEKPPKKSEIKMVFASWCLHYCLDIVARAKQNPLGGGLSISICCNGLFVPVIK